MQLGAVVSKQDLIAVLLYCGPYDLRGLYDSDKWFARFLVRQLGWAYFNVRDWRDSPQAWQASTVEHVTPDYPATFLTDGNHGSFEHDARKLEKPLREDGVRVDSLYYPAEHGTIGHEYQFDFSRSQSIECYNRTIAFLNNVTSQGQLTPRLTRHLR
jgi:acetyl esterase/lipase